MTVALADFKQYINATGDKTDAVLQDCLDDATVLVDTYVGTSVVPASLLDRAYLVGAADLWARRNAPNGIPNTQLLTADGTQAVARISRDPLAGVYGLLRAWVAPF